MLSVITMVLHFMAAASLSHTFWQEVDMMIENNDVPPYLQDALTHATFEELDLDHDGVATQPEMQEYLAKLITDSADILKAVKDIPMKYPVFQVTSTMSPEAKDAVCMMALAYEEIDFESALEKYTSDNVFAESVESFFEAAPISIDYDVWHGIGQRVFLPQVYSDELVIPDECLAVRRKLFPSLIPSWQIIATSVAALDATGSTNTVLALLSEHYTVGAGIIGMKPEVGIRWRGIEAWGIAAPFPYFELSSGRRELAFIPPALVSGGHSEYALVNDATSCEAVGMDTITTTAQCAAAVSALDLADLFASDIKVGDHHDRKDGCIWHAGATEATLFSGSARPDQPCNYRGYAGCVCANPKTGN